MASFNLMNSCINITKPKGNNKFIFSDIMTRSDNKHIYD